MTKHTSQKVVNFRHFLGCDTIAQITTLMLLTFLVEVDRTYGGGGGEGYLAKFGQGPTARAPWLNLEPHFNLLIADVFVVQLDFS